MQVTTTQTKTKILDVDSESEAEDKIFKMRQKGMNFRDILKTKFRIDGEIKGYNVVTINRIANRENSGSENSKGKTLLNNLLVSKIFALYKKDKDPVDAIISLNIDPELAMKYYELYAKFRGFVLLPRDIYDSLKELMINDLKDCGLDDEEIETGFDKILDWVKGLDYDFNELFGERIFLDCIECGSRCPLDKEELAAAKSYFRERHRCSQCKNE